MENLITFPCVNKIAAVQKWNQLVKSIKPAHGQNIAVLAGLRNNITIIDVDLKDKGLEIWKQLVKQFNFSKKLKTPTVKTPSGGLHIYFRYDASLKTGSKCVKLIDDDGNKIPIGIDIRNDNGYVIAPPSKNQDGLSYKFTYDFSDYKPISVPDWILKAFQVPLTIDSDAIITYADPLDLLDDSTYASEPSESLISNGFDVEILVQMLAALKPFRYDDYNEWIKICLIVGSIAREHNLVLLNELQHWASKSSNYNDTRTERAYNSTKGKLGFGTLFYYLKLDNPAEYSRIIALQQNRYAKDYHYEDIEDLKREAKSSAYLPVAKVEAYIKSVYVKILNSGNSIYLTKSLSNGQVKWTPLKGLPWLNNNFTFTYAADKKTNLKAVFENLLNNGDIPFYKEMDYIPYMVKPENSSNEVFNLFKPYPFEYIKDEDYKTKESDIATVEPIISHIRDILCSGNIELYNYFIRYIAHAVQRPADKPETMLAMISKMGMGKDLLCFDLLSHIFGEWNTLRIPTFDRLLKQFNVDMAGKIWIVISELQERHDGKTNSSMLKSCITDKTMIVEPKGVDTYTVKDYRRFIGFGNNSNCLSITPDDRRFVIWRNRDDPKHTEYFNNLANLIADTSVQKAYFNYLSHYDISRFNSRSMPETAFKKELQQASLHNVYRFMVDFIENYVGAEIKIHSIELFTKYHNWAQNNRERAPSNAKNFAMKLAEIGIKHDRIRINSAKREGYLLLKSDVKAILEKELKVAIESNVDVDDDSEDDSESDG